MKTWLHVVRSVLVTNLLLSASMAAALSPEDFDPDRSNPCPELVPKYFSSVILTESSVTCDDATKVAKVMAAFDTALLVNPLEPRPALLLYPAYNNAMYDGYSVRVPFFLGRRQNGEFTPIATSPKAFEAIIAHEYGHAVFASWAVTKIPEYRELMKAAKLSAKIQLSVGLLQREIQEETKKRLDAYYRDHRITQGQETEEQRNEIGAIREEVETKYLPVLGAIMAEREGVEREFEKYEALNGLMLTFHEFIADTMAVLFSDDWSVMTVPLKENGTSAERAMPRDFVDARNELETWAADELNFRFQYDPHMGLSPARYFLWNYLVRKQGCAGIRSKPVLLQKLQDAVLEEHARWKANGGQAIDWFNPKEFLLDLNRSFLARLESKLDPATLETICSR